ncbi:hypothetical protein [Falsiroseomonas ponticola]|jgi:hypothetical protein|uniref:hypothetical protein n=1 Tax=Falsiroseomonas ponticola TaxID=2786951 RepID=UPI001934857C|nr:hypothetical protein [Roseomonas ponticola]
MRPFLPPLLSLLALAACAQPAPPFDATGLTEAELVQRLGVPAGSYEAEGRRFLTFEQQGGSAPAVSPSIGFGVGRFGGGWGGGTAFGTGIGLGFGGGGAPRGCSSTFELRDGRVVGSTRQGAGCG